MFTLRNICRTIDENLCNIGFGRKREGSKEEREEDAEEGRFWRVLALEEFTDVQCIIVDLAMPSLAGYRFVGIR